MSDEQKADGAVEERIEGKAESNDSQVGITEEQIENLLRDRDKKWQSKFDKLLQEKKETETKSKTAEERIAEIEQKYERERLERVREKAIHKAKLDSDVVEAAQALLSNDAEAVDLGATKLSEFIANMAEMKANERLEAEISKRFPRDKEKPQSGKSGGELTWDEIMKMEDSQIKALPQEVLDRAMEKAKQKE